MNPLRILRARSGPGTTAGFALAALMAIAPMASAGLPEPDAVFYGTIVLDGVLATAADVDVTVEVRQTEEGPPVTSYRMGDSGVAGDRYLVRTRVESAAPLGDPGATPLGGTVHLVVKKGGVVRAIQAQMISERGSFVNLNFGDADSDGDGMSDAFEESNFGSATGGDPNGDPDLDGRPNRREFLQGTNPNVADGRHPADLNPADDRLNIQEVTEYALAWKLGESWTIEPLIIPVDYVTRASALWVGGERYVFDNDPATTAPLWWVPDPSSLPPEAGLSGVAESSAPATAPDLRGGGAEASSWRSRLLSEARVATRSSVPRRASQPVTEAGVTRELPWSFSLHQSFTVSLTVVPAAETRAYAVEESPPAGWLIRFISGGGRFDARNQRIKWGPFYGSEPQILTYELTPLSANGEGQFAGAGSFDGSSRTILGRSAVFAPGSGPVAQLSVISHGPGARVQLHGAPGETYFLETSADLQGWSALEPLTTDTSGQAQRDLPDATGLRFFRLRP